MSKEVNGIKVLKEIVEDLQKQRDQLNLRIKRAVIDIVRLEDQKKFNESLPERHGFAWEDYEWYRLSVSLNNLIENRMNNHKRTRSAIEEALKKLLSHRDYEEKIKEAE